MCPVCIGTTLALIAAGAGSAGGLTALIVKKVGGGKTKGTSAPSPREAQDRSSLHPTA